LTGLTTTVLETALEAEMDEHLGYRPYAVEGRNSGNSRNGSRSKTVLTEVGDVTIDVARDRDGSFEPRIVAKRQRRLAGVASWLGTGSRVAAEAIEASATNRTI
jgi:transposase-like protein